MTIASAFTVTQSISPWGDAFERVHEISRFVAGSPSATQALEALCGVQLLAQEGGIQARKTSTPAETDIAEAGRAVDLFGSERIEFRPVTLHCGPFDLVRAENFFVPERLSVKIRERLEETTTPFWRVLSPLSPVRETVSIQQIWTAGEREPPELFEHRVLIRSGTGRSLAYIVETYLPGIIKAMNAGYRAKAG